MVIGKIGVMASARNALLASQAQKRTAAAPKSTTVMHSRESRFNKQWEVDSNDPEIQDAITSFLKDPYLKAGYLAQEAFNQVRDKLMLETPSREERKDLDEYYKQCANTAQEAVADFIGKIAVEHNIPDFQSVAIAGESDKVTGNFIRINTEVQEE